MTLQPHDAADDRNHRQLWLLSKRTALPNFVKDAAVATAKEQAGLAPEVFGDPAARKFPTHTKAAAWLSYAYFLDNRGAYATKEAAHIQDRLRRAGQFWGIAPDLTRLDELHAKEAAAVTKVGEADEDYALVAVVGDRKIRRMPLTDPFRTKLAGEFLCQNRRNYPYAWRKTAARKILLKAAQYALRKDVTDEERANSALEGDTRVYLEKAAGYGMTTPLLAAERLAVRTLMIPPQFHDLKIKMAELTQAVRSLRRCPPPYLQKLAEAVDKVDREVGLCRFYDQGVELPEELFFTVLEKQAADVLGAYVSLTTGNAWSLEDVARLPLAKIAAVLGNDFADAVVDASGLHVDLQKFAEVAPTLPRDDAVLLEKAMAAAGTEKSAAELLLGKGLNQNDDGKPGSKSWIEGLAKDHGLKARQSDDFSLILTRA